MRYSFCKLFTKRVYKLLKTGYIISIPNKPFITLTKTTIMTKATTRPTAAQIQQNQARADRKAAALARRNDDYRQDAGFVALYSNN